MSIAALHAPAQAHGTDSGLPRPIYPGHPLVIALHIMQTYPSYDAANAPTEDGWCAAVGDIRIPGAGDHVTAAMQVLGMRRGGASVDQMIEAARGYWLGARAGGHRDRIAPGQEQAEQLTEQFKAAASNWSWDPGMPAV